MASPAESGSSVPPPLPSAEDPVCKCGAQPLSAVSQLPVCEPCRQKLIRRPLPLWIKATAAVVVILLIVAFARFPSALWAGIHYERGQRLEGLGKYDLAVKEYEAASQRYHTSTELHLRLAIAEFKAGEIQKSAQELDSLSGREVPKDMAGDVRWLESQFEKVVEMQKKQSNP